MVVVVTLAVSVSSVLAGTANAASGRPPVKAPLPAFVADIGSPDAQVLLIPGTGDPTGIDQVARTYRWWGNRPVQIIDYPASFGVIVGTKILNIIGVGTYNSSELTGEHKAALAARAALRAGRPVIINGFSQGANVAMNAAYTLTHEGAIAPGKLTVVLGADPRFPNTGLDTVAPSLLPGVATDGPRDPADLKGTKVISYCIRGDSVCGLANPIADPAAAALYFVPGYYVHAFIYPQVGKFKQVKNWRDGDTRYYVYDGGNPLGIMLRDLGVPVGKNFDDAVSKAVPVPMPGDVATNNGKPVPTPRMLQEQLYRRLGLQLPLTDPDSIARSRRQVRPVRMAPPTRTPGKRAAVERLRVTTPSMRVGVR
ncbi:PE-PPE domain-containing protein [Gordonia sp. TBRC 11910]|uniref:PE-PPE domain-containing protein n=1 Tax=Gordonia asplenii TaxID=2725283 RepID=A0A848KZQ9_9ACTN|nr:PE-PPE domain-containing protein [Gordonia asplenii]NMO01681.1 PE-PPE domain-containing protein [Gordonia asplenii]